MLLKSAVLYRIPLVTEMGIVNKLKIMKTYTKGGPNVFNITTESKLTIDLIQFKNKVWKSKKSVAQHNSVAWQIKIETPLSVTVTLTSMSIPGPLLLQHPHEQQAFSFRYNFCDE